MNNKARAIGLTQTKFLNESGLDLESYQSGASGSARDMARLFEYVYRRHPTLLSATAKGDLTITSDSNITHHVMNTDAMVNDIPGIIASKTGFTDLAGGNLVVILDIGIDHPVAISVLGSTKESRFSDMQKLIDATVSTITEVPYAN
jgi:D-alanyl-D-alanine carboxypeptidase